MGERMADGAFDVGEGSLVVLCRMFRCQCSSIYPFTSLQFIGLLYDSA